MNAPVAGRPSVRVPAELTVLRDKVANGTRVSQYEALRICELEKWLTQETSRVLDAFARTEGGPTVAVD